jgi:hypothetical protein
MKVSIEWSKSGATFGIAFSKSEGDKPFAVTKGCKIVERKDGSGKFVSGPSSKLENGEFLNYLYLDQGFGDHVLKLALESQPKAGVMNKAKPAAALDNDPPF